MRFRQVIAESGLEDWKVADYEAMRDDAPRTAGFEAAIRRSLAARGAGQATVLDIGTGPFALLAIMAARAGARHVYAVEKNPAAASLARGAVEKAGLEGIVQVIEGDSMQVELPEKVDLVVSELIGSIATQEGVEPIIRDAGRRLLKDGGAMIPQRCQTCIAPVFLKGRSPLDQLFNPRGPGLRSRGTSAPGASPPLRVRADAAESSLQLLAEPRLLEDFDYTKRSRARDGRQQFDLSFDVPDGGRFSGFAMWTRVVVDEQSVVEVRGQLDSHWAYVVSLMTREREPVRLSAPSSIRLGGTIDYDASPVRYELDAEVVAAA